MSTPEVTTVADGKYTVINDNGKLTALRYGQPWRDLCGDNLVYWLTVELRAARAALTQATTQQYNQGRQDESDRQAAQPRYTMYQVAKALSEALIDTADCIAIVTELEKL